MDKGINKRQILTRIGLFHQLMPVVIISEKVQVPKQCRRQLGGISIHPIWDTLRADFQDAGFFCISFFFYLRSGSSFALAAFIALAPQMSEPRLHLLPICSTIWTFHIPILLPSLEIPWNSISSRKSYFEFRVILITYSKIKFRAGNEAGGSSWQILTEYLSRFSNICHVQCRWFYRAHITLYSWK